jgi:predicted glycosyltransferase involved in capsule biosynthesis
MFNKSLALNLGVLRARSDVLLFLDADVILEGNTVQHMLARRKKNSFVTVDRIIESRRTKSLGSQVRAFSTIFNISLSDGRKAKAVTSHIRPNAGTRSAPGLIMLPRHAFIQIGGMNSSLSRWGWEDIDLVLRLQICCGLRQICVGRAQHLSHGDEVRLLNGSRADSEAHNFEQCLANYALGLFSGTYTEDVSAFENACTIAQASR